MADTAPVLVHDSSSESDFDTVPRKRRRLCESTCSNDSLGQVDTDPTSVDDQDDDRLQEERQITRQEVSHIAVSGSAFPRSVYQGYETPTAPIAEREALEALRAAHIRIATGDEEYIYFSLDHFTIYKPRQKAKEEDLEDPGKVGRRPVRGSHTHELVGLHSLQTHKGPDELLFDGVLSCRSEQRYVQGVRFSILAIDYDGSDGQASVGGRIFIQSPLAKRHDSARHDSTVWYQLGTPAREYTRFYSPFVWLAQFTEYFLDYLLLHQGVTLQHFQRAFAEQLQEMHASKERFDTWLRRAPLPCGNRDFRATVCANVGFLWKECYGLPGNDMEHLLRHPLWGEIDEYRLTAIPRQQDEKAHTVVTPYAYDSFKHMYFADRMELTTPDFSVRERMARRKLDLGLTPLGTQKRHRLDDVTYGSLEVQAGDVVAILPYANGRWKSKATIWYAYVQKVLQKPGKTALHVLWLYDPGDTTISTATYPFGNELFLSDNCDDMDLSVVVGKAKVAWFVKDPAATPGLFVRQKFRTVHEEDTNDFIALNHSDFACQCSSSCAMAPYEECVEKYSVNDTVLVRKFDGQLGKDTLEPAQIIHLDGLSRRVTVRWLPKTTSKPHARPNELYLSHNMDSVAPSKIIRECHIRLFRCEAVRSGLPTPYDRDGAGDYFFITYRDDTHFAEMQTSFYPLPNSKELLESTEPGTSTRPKLRGMGIFCGGGSLDRGLEDSGAVDFKYAIDWAERALHTYRANARNPECIKYWLGSVNDYHAKALAGQGAGDRVAAPDQVDLISAGSPCPGFSILQINKLSDQSRTNASLIASVVSFVDLYSPKYCILENVVAMTHRGGPNRDENVFSQVISAFVGMGYQVQQFLMESWNYGSSQQRSRLFIVASVPSAKPLLAPPYTHRHPLGVKGRALGCLTNGKSFGLRKMHKDDEDYEPLFNHISPLQATRDLTDITDAQVQLCPQYPDHRTPCELSSELRNCLAVVPVRPEGLGIVQAFRAGLVPLKGEPWRYLQGLNKTQSKSNSKTLARVLPHYLFPTVTTSMRVHDGNIGRWVHWQQHRMVTVMEARRAQGFLDDEVIIGSPAQQVKIIGNSVDRKVSLVLGLALRESWLKSAFARSEEGTDYDDAVLAVDPESSDGLDWCRLWWNGITNAARVAITRERLRKT